MTFLRHLAIFLFVCSGLAAADPWPADCDLVLVLDGAIARREAPDETKAVRLRLQRFGGAWHPLIAADSRVQEAVYNHGDHHGCIVSVEPEGSGTAIAVSLRIEADPWSDTAGYARYRLVAAPGSSGAVTGTWTGTALGVERQGELHGRVIVADPFPGFMPPEPGEHPRFLIRRMQIPALREKMRTPAGAKDLERLKRFAGGGGELDATERAVALGLLYHLEDDPAYAAQAKELLGGDVGNWANVEYVHGAAARVLQGALAFDLVHDACDEKFRANMRDVFTRKFTYLYSPPVGGFNPNDGSNWSAMYRSALGMAALAVAAEPTSALIEPAAPAIPAPSAMAKPTGDVPVVPVESGRTISAWIHAGPFAVAPGTDVLAGLGGAATACPAIGTAVTCREAGKDADTTVPFATVPVSGLVAKEWADKYSMPQIEGGVEFAALTGRKYQTTTALHTVLEVAEPGVYRVEYSTTKMEGLGVWLGGIPMTGAETDPTGQSGQGTAGGLVRLAPGCYPLTVVASIGSVGNWEIIESFVRLVPLLAGELAAVEARQAAMHAHEHAVWRAVADAGDRFGPLDPVAHRWLAAARNRLALWEHDALGDAGWNHEGEAYTQHLLHKALPFAHAYRNVCGRSLFTDDWLAQTFALYATKTIFRDGAAVMPSYGPGGGPLGVDNWARGFALVKPEHRAACLEAWDRTQALADGGTFTGECDPVATLDGVAAAFRFINHPGDTLAPVAGQGLTHLTVDRERGGLVFRDGWTGGDDAVVTWFPDTASRGGGWKAPDAGAFRLSALGHDWAVRGISFGNGSSSRTQENPRWFGNVVTVKEAPALGRGPRATDLAVQPCGDQAWVASARFDICYLGEKVEQRGKKKVRTAVDLGITAARHFAVDYSATSGVPVLVAVADRLTGTKGDTTWSLATLPAHVVTVDETGFTIAAQDGTTLRATVAAPIGPTIAVKKVTIRHEINYHARHQQRDLPRQVVEVSGGENYLVVMTVQAGNAPAVTLADSVVTIGKRRIAVRDSALVLEDVQ